MSDLREAVEREIKSLEDYANECDRLSEAVLLGAAKRLRAAVARPALPAPPACPECQAPLKAVRYPGGALNKDQWESVRAGDWFCDSTVMHAQLRQDGNVYFWNREVAALPAPEPPDQKESESMSEKPYSRAESMESALRDLLAVAWDFLEDCATKEQLSEAAVRARRRLEA